MIINKQLNIYFYIHLGKFVFSLFFVKIGFEEPHLQVLLVTSQKAMKLFFDPGHGLCCEEGHVK